MSGIQVIKRYISWNLFGMVMPAIVAVITMPLIIKNVGREAFGFLVLTWGLIGYASLLDFGIGKSLTYQLSKLKDKNKKNEISSLIYSAEFLGIFISIAVFFLLPILAYVYLDGKVDELSDFDLIISVILITFSVILQLYASIYRGVNEAYLKFKKISIIRFVVGVTNFIGPLCISLYKDELYWLIMPIFIIRAFSVLVYRHGVKNQVISEACNSISTNSMKSLFKFGGWVSVSNICVMIMMQSDKYTIGYILDISQISEYALPYEIVIKLMILMGAITTALFPILSRELSISIDNANKLIKRWVIMSLALMSLPLLVIYNFSSEILTYWLSGQVSQESINVSRVLVVGVFLNIFTALQYCYLQACNKVKAIGYYQVMQTPLILILMYQLVLNFGVIGAAYVWVIRVIIDFGFYSILLLLFNINNRKSIQHNFL